MGSARRIARCRMARHLLAGAPFLLALGILSCFPFPVPQIRIAAWSPAVDHPSAVEGIDVWVEFSAAVNRTKAEEAFTLKEGSSVLPGRFSWQGNRMGFLPYEALSAGRDYEMTVMDTVEDDLGVSLEKDFHFSFSTKSDRSRPMVVSVSPPSGAVIDNRLTPVVIVFSEPVDQASFYAAFSLSPPVSGSFTWSPDGAACTYTPAQQYAWRTEYLVSVGTGLADPDRNTMSEAYSTRFMVGSDAVPPALMSLRNTAAGVPGAVLAARDDPVDGSLTVNDAWECSWGFELRFSEPVLRESVDGLLSITPGWAYTIQSTSLSSDAFLLKPAERLSYGVVYTLTLKAGIADEHGNRTPSDAVYHFRANGPLSTPPGVVKIRFRSDPLDPPASADYGEFAIGDAFHALDLSAFPVGTGTPTYLDLYLSIAQGAAVNLMSLMGAFSISATNGCADISITGMRAAGFSDPQPVVVGGAVPVRIDLDITNRAPSGVMTFTVSAELADSAGNPIAAAWQLPLLK